MMTPNAVSIGPFCSDIAFVLHLLGLSKICSIVKMSHLSDFLGIAIVLQYKRTVLKGDKKAAGHGHVFSYSRKKRYVDKHTCRRVTRVY